MSNYNIQKKVLRTTCKDQAGLISKITSICYKHNLNILENSEYVDHSTDQFFMRTELEGIFNEQILVDELYSILPADSLCELQVKRKQRVVILVTKEAHCLGDLLIKNSYGGLDIEIVAVIGNHTELKELVDRFNIPFHFVSHEGLDREQHDFAMIEQIDAYHPDFIVLAKYMRVLTSIFVEHYPNKVINIHHSSLPAFVGARPYHQAHNRGVKLIGATAHFINNDLDQGPIITQHVIHVDHTFNAHDMARAGRDVEKTVLNSALFLVFSQRVFVCDNRTIIL